MEQPIPNTVSVDVVDPLVGALPDDGSHPEWQVGRHKVDETKPENGIHNKNINDKRNNIDERN